MTQLTLTSDQVLLLSGKESSFLVCRPDGQVVGVLSKTGTSESLKNIFSRAEIEAAERELEQSSSRHTTNEILDRLEAIDES